MTQNIYDMADTWNEASTLFTAIGMNVTDTSSSADSLLFDLRIGGVSRFAVRKDSQINLGNNAVKYGTTNRITFGPVSGPDWFFAAQNHVAISSFIGLGASNLLNPDARIYRDAADTIALLRGSSPQTFNIYNTISGGNYERFRFGWSSNVFQIGPEASGTGEIRVLHISGLPTSNPGAGILWNDGGEVRVGT